MSTAHYYRGLNAGVAERLGGNHCAPIVLWQTDFARITELQEAGRWDEAGEVLAAGARSLVAAGADMVAICANTMHLVAPAVAAAAGPVPLVSIIDAVADECVRRGVRTVGLFGTAYTMESSELFPVPMRERGIEVLVPEPDERAAIHRITFDELIHDVVTDDSRWVFADAARGLIGRGADAVLLACTEHGLMLGPEDLPVPVLDSSEIHIRALIDRCVDA